MVRPTIGISLVRRQKRRDHHTRRFLETDTSILNIGNGLSNPPYLRRLVVVDVDSVGRPAAQMSEPEDSMRYMCLIYDNEQTWAKMSKPEADAVMGEYFAFTKDIRSSGHYQAGRPSRRCPPQPLSGFGTASCPPPTARSRRRRSISAAS